MSDLVFKGFKIKKIDFQFIDEGKDNASIGYKIEKISDYSYELFLELEFIDSDRNDEKILKLCVQISGLFDFVGDDRENLEIEQIEEIVKINGSAILFPYIRALIQNITSYDTSREIIMLPAINITEVIREIDKNNQMHSKEDKID